MKPQILTLAEAPYDQPVPLLERLQVHGENMLVARVTLHPGCVVKVHHHESEQIAIILSGRVKWTLGDEAQEVEMCGGQVIVLPSNYPHGVVAIEETHIIDVLSPNAPMGVDAQQ